MNAMYSDGALYISNVQDNNEDMKDDIVHEISHAVEERYKDIAYEEGATKIGFYSILDKIIKTGSKVAINISEKI